MKKAAAIIITLFALLTAADNNEHSSTEELPQQRQKKLQKFMGWYGVASHASELQGQINSFWSKDPEELTRTFKEYGYSQQLLDIQDVFLVSKPLDGPHNALQLKENWTAILDEKKPVYRKLLNDGVIVGFMVGDELQWSGLTHAQLNAWTRALRERFPSAFMWENESGGVYRCPADAVPPQVQSARANCTDYVGRPIFAGYNRSNVSPYLNATSIDWYVWAEKDNQYNFIQRLKEEYETRLVPRLAPGQKVFVIPGAAADKNNSACSFECYDTVCAKDAGEFLQWIQQNSSFIAGAMPWTWTDCGVTVDDCAGRRSALDPIGARHMNKTKAAWADVGKTIMSLPFA